MLGDENHEGELDDETGSERLRAVMGVYNEAFCLKGLVRYSKKLSLWKCARSA